MGKISFRPDDVLLVVNYFGISKCLKYRKDQRQRITIIEDHTHDPWSDWSYSSKADWCIASLRKLLPLPDGGVLWSPLNHPMPSAVSITRKRKYASLQKIAGMSLKSLYIQGGAVKKDTFRPLLIDAEKEIAKGALSGMTDWSKDLLSSYPVDRWREKRRINHRCLSYNLSDLPWLTVPVIADEKGRCPYSGIIVFANAGLCSYVRDKLIKTDIYPAVLWPLEKSIVKGIPDQYVELSRRLLSICCDMRYDEEDMLYVGRKIREYGNEYINVRL